MSSSFNLEKCCSIPEINLVGLPKGLKYFNLNLKMFLIKNWIVSAPVINL